MDCWEQNIRLRRRMGVPLAGVNLLRTNGETALAPHLGILGRGAFQVNGQWGSNVPAVRPTLGTALLVSCQPRDRMGFGGLARQHARHQLQWHVHRIGRSFVDRGGFYRAFGAGPARKSRLLREAHRAGARHGGGGDAFRRAARTAVSRSSGFSLPHRFLSSSYTMLAAARIGSRGLGCVQRYSPPSFGTAFEVA
jgi:hypothetical protein